MWSDLCAVFGCELNLLIPFGSLMYSCIAFCGQISACVTVGVNIGRLWLDPSVSVHLLALSLELVSDLTEDVC